MLVIGQRQDGKAGYNVYLIGKAGFVERIAETYTTNDGQIVYGLAVGTPRMVATAPSDAPGLLARLTELRESGTI